MIFDHFDKPKSNNLFLPELAIDNTLPEKIRKICIFHHDSYFNHQVIEELTSLSNHFNNVAIYNWGNISFSSLDQLKEIHEKLENEGYIVIFIGGSSSEAELLWDNFFGNFYLSSRISNTAHDIDQKNVNYIGYQRHFSSLSLMNSIENNTTNSISLGRIRSLGNQIEPILRDTRKAYVDLNVLKSSELMGNPDTSPAGLSAEELCQIMRYIGEANHLTSLIINTNLNSQSSRNTNEAKMMALAIWYLLEGINFRLNDHPEESNDHQLFIVDLGSNIDVIFKRHNSTHRWWFELNEQAIACSQQEYEDCVNGNIPNRLSKLF
jgi:hypothetical protein